MCGYYSRDTVYVNVQPMPLSFLNYALSINAENKVQNVWSTANEVNVSGINVQRSTDGISFYIIATIPAKNGLHNEYSFTDVYPLKGVSYYRLQSVDKDGKTTYSKTEKVKLEAGSPELAIYPNPATNILNSNHLMSGRLSLTI